MLARRQFGVLCGIGAVFWLADALWIRLLPMFVVDPFWGDIGFLLSVPVAWVCVRLVARVAAIVPGVVLLVLVAALIHAAALRWAPGVYGGDHAGRLGAAWLLWIYGLILSFALLHGVQRRQPLAGFGAEPQPR